MILSYLISNKSGIDHVNFCNIALDVSKTQELSHETNAVESIFSKIEHNLNSKVNSLKPEKNSLDFISK